jgi:hypothetical protein
MYVSVCVYATLVCVRIRKYIHWMWHLCIHWYSKEIENLCLKDACMTVQVWPFKYDRSSMTVQVWPFKYDRSSMTVQVCIFSCSYALHITASHVTIFFMRTLRCTNMCNDVGNLHFCVNIHIMWQYSSCVHWHVRTCAKMYEICSNLLCGYVCVYVFV